MARQREYFVNDDFHDSAHVFTGLRNGTTIIAVHRFVFPEKELTKMRKTKIVCTVGPASSDASTLEQMCKAGMNDGEVKFFALVAAEHLKRIYDD